MNRSSSPKTVPAGAVTNAVEQARFALGAVGLRTQLQNRDSVDRLRHVTLTDTDIEVLLGTVDSAHRASTPMKVLSPVELVNPVPDQSGREHYLLYSHIKEAITEALPKTKEESWDSFALLVPVERGAGHYVMARFNVTKNAEDRYDITLSVKDSKSAPVAGGADFGRRDYEQKVKTDFSFVMYYLLEDAGAFADITGTREEILTQRVSKLCKAFHGIEYRNQQQDSTTCGAWVVRNILEEMEVTDHPLVAAASTDMLVRQAAIQVMCEKIDRTDVPNIMPAVVVRPRVEADVSTVTTSSATSSVVVRPGSVGSGTSISSDVSAASALSHSSAGSAVSRTSSISRLNRGQLRTVNRLVASAGRLGPGLEDKAYRLLADAVSTGTTLAKEIQIQFDEKVAQALQAQYDSHKKVGSAKAEKELMQNAVREVLADSEIYHNEPHIEGQHYFVGIFSALERNHVSKRVSAASTAPVTAASASGATTCSEAAQLDRPSPLPTARLTQSK